MRKPRIGKDDFLDERDLADAPSRCPTCGTLLRLQLFMFNKFPLVGARLKCPCKELIEGSGDPYYEECGFVYIMRKPHRSLTLVESEFDRIFVCATDACFQESMECEWAEQKVSRSLY